ncbi:MAG: FxLYD domain-containing protein [Acidobacteriota bacterium]
MASDRFLTSEAAKAPPDRTKLYAIGAVVIVISALIMYLQLAPKPAAQEIPLTPEAKQYITNLKLGDVAMQAKLDYFSQKVVEIQGSIGNAGDRGLDVVEVTCIFRDYQGQVLSRQRASIVSKKMGGLKPGETKTFRLPFDAVPQGWNQQMPQLVIAGIDFQ